MKAPKIHMSFAVLLVGSMVLAACNLPSQAAPAVPATVSSANAVYTAAAQTVEAELTKAANPAQPPSNTPAPATGGDTQTPAPAPAASDTPTSTLVPTEPPTATATAVCDQARFMADVTIPDNTEMLPGETFTKTWRLKNIGTCTWTSGYKLVFDQGDAMGAPAASQLTSGSVAPGQEVDVSVDMTAPADPGTYKGFFRLRNAAGVIFGLENANIAFWVEIKVVAPTSTSTATATATSTATSTPAPVTHSTGGLNIGSSWSADLDEGTVGAGGDADIWYHAVDATHQYIEVKNGAAMVQVSGTPSMYSCLGAALSNNPIPLDTSLVGHYICYQTNLGRPGSFRVNAFDGSTLTIGYTTWEIP